MNKDDLKKVCVKDDDAGHPLSPPRVCEAVEGSTVKVRERL